MSLWHVWYQWVAPLRPACARTRTFHWLLAALAAFCIREDLWGVTSFVRVLGLVPQSYETLLDFFHSPALNLDALTRLWVAQVFKAHRRLLRVHERVVLVADGMKALRSGDKMPGKKRTRQTGTAHNRPAFVDAHSCQAVAVLAEGEKGAVAAVPLAARVHEGVIFHEDDRHRTLLDKLIDLVDTLEVPERAYLVADSYYAAGKMVRALLERDHHLITRVKRNAVAYEPALVPEKRGRGRQRLYGAKVALKELGGDDATATRFQSTLYDDKNVTLRAWSRDLLWRPARRLVRFVAVDHPMRGRVVLMSTDLALTPEEIVRLYGHRFTIESQFKQALHTVGAFSYHFWMAAMDALGFAPRDQDLTQKPEEYRRKVARKLSAYQRHIQVGLIALGVLVALATAYPQGVLAGFATWLRTQRPDRIPSAATTLWSLRHSLADLYADTGPDPNLAQFLRERLDPTQHRGRALAA